MYYLKTESSFDAAHFLKEYCGKCGNIHGHRWRVVCEIQEYELKSDNHDRGMVIDFKVLKRVINEICENFDHKLIIEKDSLKKTTLKCLYEEGFELVEVEFRPTAENFARYIYEKIKDGGISVRRVEVFETPTNYAAYQEK